MSSEKPKGTDHLRIRFDRSVQPAEESSTEINLGRIQDPDNVRFPRGDAPALATFGTRERTREALLAQRAAALADYDDLKAQLEEMTAEDPFNKPFTPRTTPKNFPNQLPCKKQISTQ